MANVTGQIIKKVRATAQKLCKNNQDFADCVQEGLTRILELPHGATESFYIEAAWYRMRDYLKKERLHHGRESSNTIDLSETQNVPE